MSKIFLDYDQEALDRAYDQRAWADNAEDIIAWYERASIAARRHLAHRAGIAYGAGAKETLDLFPTADAPNAPTVVYVHGGAWRLLSKDKSAFPAEAFVAAGASFVALDFGVVPDVRLPVMVDQVQRALAWLWRHGADLGIDRERLYLCGHSSGAHLAACALTADRAGGDGPPPDFIRGGLCASGSYDLEPVMLSARGDYLRLNADEIEAYSPARHAARLPCPVVVAYGDRESPEFQRQGQAFHDAVDAAGRSAGLAIAADVNHFEISMTLAERDGLLARLMLDLMGLGEGAGR